jgi:lysophospholipase L1-like esterase
VPDRRNVKRIAHWGVMAAAVALSACSNPNEPAPNPAAPTITCPANMTTRGVPGSGLPVTYPPATVTGGAAPVTTTCNPASGASFNIGTTAVSCTAVDAASRQAQCSFTVTLTPMVVSVTKYLAFGDSLTEGENGRRLTLGSGFIDPAATYPVILQSLLNGEYPGQSVTVPNYGKSGEAVGDKANERLENALAKERPGALLLLDGYNNLLGTCAFGTSITAACSQAITDVGFGIRDLIRIGKQPEYGVRYIFVSTMTPPGPYVGIPPDRRIGIDAIVAVNTRIADMVRSESVTLVDTYPKFVGHEAEYVDQDGLHLKPAGYQALADSFFGVIKTTVTTTPGFGARSN